MLRAQVPAELVWASVTRPPVPLVYLDLNHYIQLAKARRAANGQTGEDGRPIKVLPGYAELLAAARLAKAERRAMFPLSAVHFIEVQNRVPSPRQRRHVADVMEEFSGFVYLLGRPFLVQMEISAGLDKVYGIPASYVPMPLLHNSVSAAFGRHGGFRFVDEHGNDAERQRREEVGDEEYERQMAEMNYMAERRLLEGPQDSQLAYLRTLGYAPETYEVGVQSRLDFERQTSMILENDPQWRRNGRLRDVIFARDVGHEWIELFVRHLQQREEDGFRHDEPEAPDLVALWAAMPQVQVAVSMKAHYHRDPARGWKTNDIADVDALAVAYAYCDAVLTDRQARAALTDSPDLRGFGAHLPASVTEMTTWLNDLPPVPNPDQHVFHPLPRSG